MSISPSYELETIKPCGPAALDRFGGIEKHSRENNSPCPNPGRMKSSSASSPPAWASGIPTNAKANLPKMFGTKPTFPYVMGSDGAGTVAAVGAPSPSLQRRRPCLCDGPSSIPKAVFYAEYAVVKADKRIAHPEETER